MDPMPFIDAHSHLQDPRLAADLDGVLARAERAGVEAVVVCGTAEGDWDRVVDLCQTRPRLVPMLGLHPWHVAEAQPGWEVRLEERLRVSGAGLGECGLDFAREGGDRTVQEAALRHQLRLARALEVPLALHCRKAWESLGRLVREEGLPASGALLHAFSGSAETALEMQRLGFSLSFGCPIADPENRRAAKVLPEVWPDRLLFESDAPDLPPRHLESWPPEAPNEPAQLAGVATAAARLRGEPLAHAAGLAHANARRIFARWLP